VLVAFAAPVVNQLTEHRPSIRIAYNGSVFACAAAMGGLLVSFIPGDGTDSLIAKVGVSASTQYGLNLILITLVVAVTSRRPYATTSTTRTASADTRTPKTPPQSGASP